MKLFNRFTLWFSLLLVAAGGYAPAVFASTLANDPFVRGAIARENFEPGGKYHLFGSARGTIGDREGAISPSPIYHQHLGNLEMEKIGLQGTIKYNANFSNHGHEVHAPFDNHDERSDSDERGSVADGFTLYKLEWQGHEHHPADGYDGPQGGGYPAPKGARDEYTYRVSGIAERIKLNPQIATSDERSFSERLSDSWRNFGERGAAARQKISQRNSKLNDAGNAFETGNGLIEGVIYNPIGLLAEGTGLSSLIQQGLTEAQHASERGVIRYIAAKSTEEKFAAIDDIANADMNLDWTAEKFNNLVNENPNLAEGIELVFNAAVVRGGAKIAASTAKKTATIGKDVKRFAKSEDGSLPPPKKASRNTQKSDSKHKSSDNDVGAKNAAKAGAAGSAQTAKNAGKSNQQAVKSDGKSASSSTAGKAATSTEGSSSTPSVRIQQSGGGKFSSSLGIGSLSGAGSFAVGKFVPANGPTAVKGTESKK